MGRTQHLVWPVLALMVAACGGVSSVGRHTAFVDAEAVLTLSVPAYELQYDYARNVVWLAEINRGGEDKLWRVDLSTRQAKSYQLPNVEYNGYTTHVRVADDGAAWLSLPYMLVRVDPVSGSTRSLPLALAVSGALPAAAADSGATLPGTWVTDLAVDDTSVIVARMNVPYLTRVDAEMLASRDVTLPSGYAGPRSMARNADGWIYLSPAWDATGPIIGVKPGAGPPSVVADVPATRMIDDGSSVIVLNNGRATGVLRAGALVPSAGTGASAPAWRRSGLTGTAYEYDIKQGRLGYRPEGAETVSVLQLDTISGPAVGGGGRTGTRTEILTDFVVAGDGSVWMLRHGGSVLARWAPGP